LNKWHSVLSSALLITYCFVGTSMASEDALPVPEAMEKLQTTKEALAYIDKLLSMADETMQHFVDSDVESKIRKDTAKMLEKIDSPIVLAKIATISWVIASPQNASQGTFDVVYDLAFQSAIQRLQEINTAESKMQLLIISSTVVLGSFEKHLLRNTTE